MHNVGVIVGKFQCPKPTLAHKELLEYAFTKYDTVIVFVGKSPIFNSEYTIPVQMIIMNIDEYFRELVAKYGEKKYIISFITNVYDKYIWSTILDDKIIEILNNLPEEYISVNLIGGRDSYLDSYIGGRFVNKDRFISKLGSEVSARNIRKQICERVPQKNTEDFLEGMIYKDHLRYATAFQTVDLLIFSPDKSKILLGKKPGKKKYCFVGGFSDPESNNLEEDAAREGFEETRLIVEDIKYIFSRKQSKEPRYLGTKDCVKTFFCTGVATSWNAIPSDDLKGGSCTWFKIKEVTPDMFVGEHQDLFIQYLEHRNNVWWRKIINKVANFFTTGQVK